MNTATKILLISGTVNLVDAAASPTRSSNTSFPKFASDATVSTLNTVNTTTSKGKELDTNKILDAADKNNDGVGTMAGLYRLFRFSDLTVMPTQATASRADTDAGMEGLPTLSITASGTKTFYQTSAATKPTWAGPFVNNNAAARASLYTATIQGNNYGACKTDELINTTTGVTQAASTRNNAAEINCSALIAGFKVTTVTNNATGIAGRIFFMNTWAQKTITSGDAAGAIATVKN